MKNYILSLGVLLSLTVFVSAFAETNTTTFCPNLISYLARGSRGQEVRDLQTFLSQNKDIYPEGITTGYFGALTENAVKRWQAKYNIVSSGSPKTTGYGAVGPKTRQKIKEICSAPSPLPPPPAPVPAPAPIPPSPISPSLDLKVEGSDGPITISKNSSATISWTLTNDQWSYCTKLGSWLSEGSVKTVSGSESIGGLSYNQTYTLLCYIGNQSYQDSVTVYVSQGTTTPSAQPPSSTPAPTSTQAIIPSPYSSGGVDCHLDVSPTKAVIGKDAIEAKWLLTSSPSNWPFYWHNIDNGIETGHIYGGKTSYPYNVDVVDYPTVPGKYTRYVHVIADPLWVTTNDVNHPSAACTTNAVTFEVSN